MANAGLAERVDRLAWDFRGDQPDDRRLGPGGGGRRDRATLAGRLRRPSAKSGTASEGTEGRARRRTSWAGRAAAPRSTTSAHKMMSAHATWNSRPAAASAPEWASCFAQSRALGTPGTWPVRLQSADRRVGAMGPWGEPVLRQQSRRAVASGAEARPVASGPTTDLAGCARPSRCAPRATRGRDRRAPGASERLSRPQRRRRGAIEAIVPELRSSQPGPGLV